MTLKEAVKEIDAVFGSGFAKANPSLVGAVLQANALQEIDATLVETLQHVVDASEKVNLASFGFWSFQMTSNESC
jgi:hypothetical protein